MHASLSRVREMSVYLHIQAEMREDVQKNSVLLMSVHTSVCSDIAQQLHNFKGHSAILFW